MNKLFSLLLLLSLSSAVYSQSNKTIVDVQLGFNDSLEVSLVGSAGIVSSFLSNSLVKNDFWTTDIIDEQIQSLNEYNRMGGFITAEIKLLGKASNILSKTKKHQPIFGIGHQSLTAVKLQKDVLGLGLKGNTAYRNISLETTNKFENQQFSYLKIGLAHLNPTRTSKYEIGLNLITSHKMTSGYAKNGTIQTDSISRNITMNDVELEYYQSTNKPFSDLGLSLFYSYLTRLNNNKDILKISLENVGIMSARNQINRVLTNDVDFNGFDVSENIRNTNSLNLEDSVNQNYFESDSSNSFYITPFHISAQYVYFLNENQAIDGSLSYLNFAGYYPLLEADYCQTFGLKSRSWFIGAKLGGFGTYAMNFGVKLPIGNRGLFSFQLAGLESIASENLAVNWYSNVGLILGL